MHGLRCGLEFCLAMCAYHCYKPPKLALQRDVKTPELRILKINSQDRSGKNAMKDAAGCPFVNLCGVVGCYDFDTRKSDMVIGKFT